MFISATGMTYFWNLIATDVSIHVFLLLRKRRRKNNVARNGLELNVYVG
jgi:hypothetical protein